MRLLLFTGFLGSGKTTLVIKLAQLAVERGQKIAILVNEIGEVGIDNQFMRRLDLNVWELLDGCICCTLSADLVATLQQLDADYSPDLVIIEPSGAADPRSILKALPYYRGRPLESIKIMALVDPLRITFLYEVMTPLITNQIEKADLVIITKVDKAAPQELAEARRIVQEIKPAVDLVTFSASDPLSPDLLEEVIS